MATSEPRREAIAGLVSVVIVTANSLCHLDDCLTSLQAQSYAAVEVVVVDNASTDGTLDELRCRWPWVRLVASPRNLGYAAANNLGAAHARGELLFILNPDTVVDPRCIERLVSSLQPWVGACAAKLLLHPDTGRINSDGNQLSFLGIGWANNCGVEDSAAASDIAENPLKRIPYPTGAAFLIRHDLFERLNGFDPDFFMYHEDVDLGLRIRLLGYEVICDRAAIVYHKYSFARGAQKWVWMERNRLVLLAKVYRPSTLLALLPALVWLELGILWRAGREGWLGGKLKTYGYLLTHQGTIRRKRLTVQRQRVIGDGKLLTYMRGGIYAQDLGGAGLTRIVNPTLERYRHAVLRLYEMGWLS